MTALYPALSRLPAIPWRVRKKLEAAGAEVEVK